MGGDSLRNPLTIGDITELLLALLNIVLIISVPFIVLYLIYAGYLYVTAQGNPEQVKRASSAIMFGVIGAVIIVGSFAIVAIVKNFVNSF